MVLTADPPGVPGSARDTVQAKLKAQGKLELCLKKNSAKGIGGKPDKSAKCQTKFQAALAKADQIGIAAGTVACRYVDNGDGTVSDLNTGLVWEQKNLTCPGAHCYSDHFTWCSGSTTFCTNSADPPDGTAFATFLYGLNGGTSVNFMATTGCFAGHCDWRLPTFEELKGILDVSVVGCGSGAPCIDPTFGPTMPALYWSLTTGARSPSGALSVIFADGMVGFLEKTSSTQVRAVRGGF